jgi:two-component system OmpR family sensor kinase/two-component system sensor histidine kinase BaeS
MKLKFRLTLSFLAVAALGALLSFFLVQRTSEALVRSFVFSGDSAKAKVYAGLLAEQYQTESSWTDAQRYLEDFPRLFSDATVTDLLSDRIVIVDARGVVVADTANQLLGTVHPWKHISHGIPVAVDATRVGTVLVGSMIDSALTGVSERFLADITRSLAFSTGIAAFLSLLLGILFAGRITKPLANLAKATRFVMDGKAFIPLVEKGDAEIAGLSRSFNEMTAEIRRLDAAKKRVIADSAHELRTPVTLIRGMIEGMIDGVYPLDAATLKSIHEETLRLSRLIDTLRELEVIESGELKLEKSTVNLHEMTTKAIMLFEPAAAQKSIALTLSACDTTTYEVWGDQFRLDEVLYNIISNAVKYTPIGGTIRIGELNEDKDSAGFSVEDSGSGIAPEERSRVFERLYRIDTSRSTESGGRGLGLAIACEIVKAHGGSIKIGDSELGGALFTVLLPRQ